MSDDVLARRKQALAAERFNLAVHSRRDLWARDTLAVGDAVLREAGQRRWRCVFRSLADAVVTTTEHEPLRHMPFSEEPHKPDCGWVYVIPADALAGEDDQ